MERLLIFPLNGDTEVLIQNADKSTKYEITAISSYREDIKRIEELQSKCSLYCSTDFGKCLQKVDAVVFTENTIRNGYSGYKERVEEALDQKKTIYISASLIKTLGIDSENEYIHILQKRDLTEKLDNIKLKDIQLPVLAVVGEGKNCDKFKLQANIKAMIEKKGYSVLSICSNVLGKFMDMEILPGFLFSEQISLELKIEAFNTWIYKLQENSKADIILLGCPGGILKFDEYEPNHYGEIPFAMLNSVIVDNCILTIYRNCKQNDSTMKKLSNFCQMRYNTPIDEVVMCEQYFKLDLEQKIVKYYSVQEVDGSYDEQEESELEHLSLIEDKEKLERQIDRILKELENNFFVI